MRRHEAPRWCGIVMMGIAAVSIAYGISRGEMAVVLEKAIGICLECIGIG